MPARGVKLEPLANLAYISSKNNRIDAGAALRAVLVTTVR